MRIFIAQGYGPQAGSMNTALRNCRRSGIGSTGKTGDMDTGWRALGQGDG